MNINVFLTACKELKVRTWFKNPADIEKLEMQNWEKLLTTLESFSVKLEKNAKDKGHHRITQSFKLEAKAVKDLLDTAKRTASRASYLDANYQIYGSPYQKTPSTKELYDQYNLVSNITGYGNRYFYFTDSYCHLRLIIQLLSLSEARKK